jgi:hypothetical protein
VTQAPVIYVTDTLFAAPDNLGIVRADLGPMLDGEGGEGQDVIGCVQDI